MTRMSRMRVVRTLLPNSRKSPGAATMSCLMALPPQVQPLMVVVEGETPLRSNQPPETE